MRRVRFPLAFESGRLALTVSPSEALATEIAEWCLMQRGGNPYHERDKINLPVEPYSIASDAGASSLRKGISEYFKALERQGKARLIGIRTTTGSSGTLGIVVEYADLASGTNRRVTV